MIRFLPVFFCLGFAVFSSAQVNRFREAVKIELVKTDSRTEIESVKASDKPFDFMASDIQSIKTIALAECAKKSKNKLYALKQSNALNQLAGFCTSFWKTSIYSNTKKWQGMHLKLKKALRNVNCEFGLIHSVSLRINLMHSNYGNFYYDKSEGEGQLNLFKGKKPYTKKEKEEGAVLEPLEFLTEKQILDQIWKVLNRNRITSGLSKGLYFCVGMSIELDKNTLFKNKIPTARVVIICGSRRLHLVEKKQRKKLLNQTR